MKNSLRKYGRLFWLACALAWLAGASSAWACPNCGEAIASDPAQAGLVRGIFWSILFLLSMPFLIFGCLGGYFYWLVRQARPLAPANAATSQAADALRPPISAVVEEQLETVEV